MLDWFFLLHVYVNTTELLNIPCTLVVTKHDIMEFRVCIGGPTWQSNYVLVGFALWEEDLGVLYEMGQSLGNQPRLVTYGC